VVGTLKRNLQDYGVVIQSGRLLAILKIERVFSLRKYLFALFFVLTAVSLWFFLNQPMTMHGALVRIEDLFDGRPQRRILIIGNSRTYFNDMPEMVRSISDSASDPNKLEISLRAFPGATFEEHWSDPKTQAVLAETWDDAIMQSESAAESSPETDKSFRTFGKLLGKALRLRSGKPRIVVNWVYGPESWDDGDPDGSGREAYYHDNESATSELSSTFNGHTIDVASVWRRVEREHPEIRLTQDGNHPTVAGSYLFALLLYADLSDSDVKHISYVPSGLDPEIAATLRSYA